MSLRKRIVGWFLVFLIFLVLAIPLLKEGPKKPPVKEVPLQDVPRPAPDRGPWKE